MGSQSSSTLQTFPPCPGSSRRMLSTPLFYSVFAAIWLRSGKYLVHKGKEVIEILALNFLTH